MTSTVVWYRYADKQPGRLMEVLFVRGDLGGSYIARHRVDSTLSGASGVWQRDVLDFPCDPDDVWCYLPTPPQEDSAGLPELRAAVKEWHVASRETHDCEQPRNEQQSRFDRWAAADKELHRIAAELEAADA